MNEFAIELISCTLTPRSHSLISPLLLMSMFDGFTSATGKMLENSVMRGNLTSMQNVVNFFEIGERL